MYYKQTFWFVVLTLILTLPNCQEKKEPNSTDLFTQLSQLEGKYVKQDSIYYYDQKEKIATILQKADTVKMLEILSAGLDNPDLSNSTIEGKRVPIGLLYYEALTQKVYYESVDSTGDIAAHWDGHIKISPEVNLSHLKRAKSAWTKVIKSKTYIFL